MALEKRTGEFGEYWGNTFDSSNALSLEQMKINATYIWNYLGNKGWTKNAVAGMLGNMQSESSINPRTLAKRQSRWRSRTVTVTGLVQWTPYTKYTEWVSGDPSTMDNNLSRIIYEIENNIQWIPTQTYNFSFEEFSKSELSPYELGLAFLTNYERPAEPNQPQRGTQAEFWFEFLGGIITKKKKNKWLLERNKKILIYT